jgi:hypothetical protein
LAGREREKEKRGEYQFGEALFLSFKSTMQIIFHMINNDLLIIKFVDILNPYLTAYVMTLDIVEHY